MEQTTEQEPSENQPDEQEVAPTPEQPRPHEQVQEDMKEFEFS